MKFAVVCPLSRVGLKVRCGVVLVLLVVAALAICDHPTWDSYQSIKLSVLKTTLYTEAKDIITHWQM